MRGVRPCAARSWIRTSRGRSGRSGLPCCGSSSLGWSPFPLMLILIGFPLLVAAHVALGIWIIYRVVRGWLALRDRRADVRMKTRAACGRPGAAWRDRLRSEGTAVPAGSRRRRGDAPRRPGAQDTGAQRRSGRNSPARHNARGAPTPQARRDGRSSTARIPARTTTRRQK